MSVELLVLVDNQATVPPLRSEHGLSILIRTPDGRVMFDTGSSPEILQHNAESLEVDLSQVDAVVVSHGHCDHTGGLAVVARHARPLDIYAHPSVFSRRWSDKPGQPLRDVSCRHSLRTLTGEGAVFHAVNAPLRLNDGMVLSGPFGRAAGGREMFVVRRDDEIVIDEFEDEIFLLVRGRDGWVIVTGCCHHGLKSMLRSAKFLARDEPVAAIVGGLHLRNAHQEDLEAAADVLERSGSPQLHLCHCTGEEATPYLLERFGDRAHAVGAGSRIEV